MRVSMSHQKVITLSLDGHQKVISRLSGGQERVIQCSQKIHQGVIRKSSKIHLFFITDMYFGFKCHLKNHFESLWFFFLSFFSAVRPPLWLLQQQPTRICDKRFQAPESVTLNLVALSGAWKCFVTYLCSLLLQQLWRGMYCWKKYFEPLWFFSPFFSSTSPSMVAAAAAYTNMWQNVFRHLKVPPDSSTGEVSSQSPTSSHSHQVESLIAPQNSDSEVTNNTK